MVTSSFFFSFFNGNYTNYCAVNSFDGLLYIQCVTKNNLVTCIRRDDVIISYLTSSNSIQAYWIVQKPRLIDPRQCSILNEVFHVTMYIHHSRKKKQIKWRHFFFPWKKHVFGSIKQREKKRNNLWTGIFLLIRSRCAPAYIGT